MGPPLGTAVGAPGPSCPVPDSVVSIGAVGSVMTCGTVAKLVPAGAAPDVVPAAETVGIEVDCAGVLAGTAVPPVVIEHAARMTEADTAAATANADLRRRRREKPIP